MKMPAKYLSLLCLMVLTLQVHGFKKGDLGNWKEKQLISPQILLDKINMGDTANLLLLNTGPVEDIKGAVNIGAVEDARHLARLKEYLKDIPKDKEIIIYCGCCPLSVCPNLQPAYDALKKMKFKNYKVLKLTHDLQEDWIDKGYPVQQ